MCANAKEPTPQPSYRAAVGYGSDGSEHSYTEIVDALRQHGAQPQTNTEELW